MGANWGNCISGRFSGLSPPTAALQASRFTAGNLSTSTVSFQPVSTGFPIHSTRELSVVVLTP
ncbi:MAG: hypothetical protein Q7R41_10910, partial [Phycisphaerales bacterium]|nr:hypothetical protein [Phycisphaerales bacterium]